VKAVRYSPAAREAFVQIFQYSLDNWGSVDAERYLERIIDRVDALARGEPPHARPCEVLMRGSRDAASLRFYRVGSHVILLRELPTEIEVVDVVHQSRNIEAEIDRLLG
jgi:toxin ParE1/3/4